MGWVLFFTVFFFLLYGSKHFQDPNKGKTIGDTIKKGGYYYSNIGDENDEDCWVMVGKYEPIYYVNVYETEDNIILKIEDVKNDQAKEYFECEAEDGVKLVVDIQKNSYTSTGKKVVIDERMKEINRIMENDPYYQKRRRYYLDKE